MARKGASYTKVVFEEKIKNELNSYLRREFSDKRLVMASFTRVELNPDYSVAKVFWDTFDRENRGEIKLAIDGTQGKMRSLLAKNLNIRHTPEVKFIYDSQFEDELKITDLLKNND